MWQKFKFDLKNFAIFLIFFSFIFLLNFTPSYAWLSGWQYRRAINITNLNITINITDYQVLVTLNTQTLISQGKMRSDCGDIRFTNSSDYLLNYWIESGCNTTSTKIWVKVPNIPANSNTTIYVYYGNPNATSLSNGTATFDYFDDFNTNTTSQYTRYDQSSSTTLYWDSSQGTVYSSGESSGYQHSWVANSYQNYADSMKIIARVKASSTSGQNRPAVILLKPTDSTTFVYLGVEPDRGYISLHKYLSSTDYLVSNIASASYNTWYVIQMVKIGTTYHVWYGSSLSSLTYGGNFSITDSALTGYTPRVGFSIRNINQRSDFDYYIIAKYTSPEPTTSIGNEELVNSPPQITIYSPQNTTYFHSNNFVFNFSASDDRNSTFWIRAFLDGVMIYENTNYQNNTIITLTRNLTDGTHTFTVWANDTQGATSALTIIFTIKDFEIQQITYNTNVYETSQQTFTEVIRYNPDLIKNISSTLIYNQSAYPQTSQTISGNVITNLITITVPQTNLRANNTFYISNQISYYNSTTAIVNTSTYYQIVFTTRSNWLQPFGIRRAITFISNQTYVNALVPISVDTLTLINNFKLNSSCQDIRITDIDGITLLPIRIDNCNTTNTTIWFNSTYIPNNLTISYYIYYGNPQASLFATTFSGYNVSLFYNLGNEEVRAVRIFQYDEQNRSIFLFQPTFNVLNPETCVVIGNNPFFFVNPNQTCFFYQSQPHNSSYTTSDIYVGQLTNYIVSNYAILSAYSSPITFLLKNAQKDCNKYALRLERLYDVYKYVKDSFFDYNCIATVYLQPYQIYRLYVIDMDTNTVVYQTSAFKIVQNSFTIDLNIQPLVQIVSSNYLNNYNQLISYGCGLNGNTITCYANNLNTLPINVSFKVERKLLVGYYTLCQDNQKASSLTFNCPLDNNTKEAFVSLVWNVEDYNTTKILFADYIQTQVSVSTDYSGIAVAMIFFLGMTALGIFNPFVSILLGIVALVVSVKLELIYLSISSIIGLVLVLIIVKIKEENV